MKPLYRCSYCRGDHRGANCDRVGGNKPCSECWNLPWRRDVVGGCATCGLPFGVEVVKPIEPRNASPIADWSSF